MYIDRKNTVNTRKPFKTGEVPEAIKITKPLCSRFPDEGSVDFHSQSDMNAYEGIFSFVLYYNSNLDDFKKSRYYLGLLFYAEIIHQNPYFINYGMIVYTDDASYTLLSSVLLIYPKLILAVTHWPQFSINSTITGTVLRCLRFHALEAFPNSHILVRDADTIFVAEIASFDYIYANGYKTRDATTGEVIEDYRQFLIDKIGAWEKQFVDLWFKEGSPMLFGLSPAYLHSWHSEFPFIYPIKNVSKKYKKTLNKEHGGRFRNYKKTDFYKQSPSGTYAGFVNFLRTRPNDLWLYSYDYIQRHYKLIEVEDHKKEISNQRLWISDVGKDERILIFTMIIKYVSKCFFLVIKYDTSIEQTYYFSSNTYNKYVPLATIIDEVSFNKSMVQGKIVRRKIKDIYQIRTQILEPNYLPSAFNEKLGRYTRLALTDSSDYYDNLKKNNEGKSLNEIYKSHFKTFSSEYLSWLTFIMSIPEEDIQETLDTIIKSKRWGDNGVQYENDYISLNESNFYEPPRRIEPSRLPPIIPEDNSDPLAKLKGGRYTRSLKKKGGRYTRSLKKKNIR